MQTPRDEDDSNLISPPIFSVCLLSVQPSERASEETKKKVNFNFTFFFRISFSAIAALQQFENEHFVNDSRGRSWDSLSCNFN
jgi:hypothetical protein